MPEATSCLEVHGGSEQLEVLLGLAGEDRPPVACMAERGSPSEWQLTHYGASALETVEIRVGPRLLFELLDGVEQTQPWTDALASMVGELEKCLTRCQSSQSHV